MRDLGSPGQWASRADQHAPPAKRARPLPAAPALPADALSESDDSGSSDDDKDENYLSHAKRAQPSAQRRRLPPQRRARSTCVR